MIGAEIFKLVRGNKDFFKLLYIDVLEFNGVNVVPMVSALRRIVNKQSEDFLAPRLGRGDLVDSHPALVMRIMIDVFLHSYLDEVMLDQSLADQLGMSDEELAEAMAKLLLYGIMRRDP